MRIAIYGFAMLATFGLFVVGHFIGEQVNEIGGLAIRIAAAIVLVGLLTRIARR